METKTRAVRSRWEKSLTLLAMLVLLLVSVCLFCIIYEPAGEYLDDPPPVVTASNYGSSEDGPKIVGGFVPERRMGPPPDREAPLFLSWDFINALFAIIIAFEVVVFPLLFWLWFGRQQHVEESKS